MTTIEEAYKIIGIKERSSVSDVRRAYRKLALIYHPDRCKDPDASIRFIQIAAAYEVIINYIKKAGGLNDLSEDEKDDLEEELKEQLVTIKKAFQKIKTDFNLNLNNAHVQICECLTSLLKKYESASDIKKYVPSEYPNIVKGRIFSLISDINLKMQNISLQYQDWMTSFLRDTYKLLASQAVDHFYKSKLFWIIFLFSGLSVGLVFGFIFYSLWSWLGQRFIGVAISNVHPVIRILLLAIVFFIIIFFISRAIHNIIMLKKYFVKNAIIAIESDKLNIKLERLVIQGGEDETSGLGVLIGSMGGMFFGGPIGAGLGAVLGGWIGSLFGEKLDKIKEKIAQKMTYQVYIIIKIFSDQMNLEIDNAEQKLIEMIRENYSQNKKKAIKLLMSTTFHKK